MSVFLAMLGIGPSKPRSRWRPEGSPENPTSSSPTGSPVDMERRPDGSTTWKRSPRGLVTALEPILRRHRGAWISWPGIADEIPGGGEPEPIEQDGLTLVPVGLSTQEVADYYEGFSNATLWPLYHDVIVRPEYHRHWWDNYVEVNRRFAETTARTAAPGADRVGAGLPAAAGAQDAADAAPGSDHRLLPAHPLPAGPSCSCRCRGAPRSSRASWSAGPRRLPPRRRRAQNFLVLARRLIGANTSRATIGVCGHGSASIRSAGP